MFSNGAPSASVADGGAVVLGEFNYMPGLVGGPAASARAAAGGVGVWRFAWLDSQGIVSNVRGTAGDPVGVVLPPFSLLTDWRRMFFDPVTSTWRIREGLNVSLIAGGNMRLRFANGAYRGQPVYANVLDGSPISGNSLAGELTPWSVQQDAPPGGLALISTWSKFS